MYKNKDKLSIWLNVLIFCLDQMRIYLFINKNKLSIWLNVLIFCLYQRCIYLLINKNKRDCILINGLEYKQGLTSHRSDFTFLFFIFLDPRRMGTWVQSYSSWPGYSSQTFLDRDSDNQIWIIKKWKIILYVQELVPLQKKHLIYLHQKMRFKPFINYYDTLGWRLFVYRAKWF